MDLKDQIGSLRKDLHQVRESLGRWDDRGIGGRVGRIELGSTSVCTSVCTTLRHVGGRKSRDGCLVESRLGSEVKLRGAGRTGDPPDLVVR